MALSVQDLQEIRKIIVATQMVIHGEFETELKGLDDAADKAKTARIAEVEQAEIMAANNHAARVAEIEDMMAKARMASDDNQKSIESVSAQIQKLNDLRAEVDSKQAGLAQAQADIERNHAAVVETMMAREEAVATRERAMSVMESKLLVAQQDLDARLAKLAELAGR